jgi:hypothetical protein
MIVYSLLSVTLLLAILSLYLLWSGMKRTVAQGWHRLLLSITLAIFVYLYGCWFILSIYLKYVFGIFFIGALLAGITKRKYDIAQRHPERRAALNLFLSILFGTLSVLYFTGTTGETPTVNLAFPFKTGRYFVMQGGKGLPANFFHAVMRSEIYAMDIAKLNNTGNRAKHIFSKKLNDYEVFGDTIYSPCAGLIKHAVDSNPDNIPPTRIHGHGKINGILIGTDSFFIFLGHLKHGSLLVHENELVKQGQPLACAGNSGFTIEPHLHIQAHMNTHSGIPWYQEKPLFIQFDHKNYLLGDIINSRW